MNARARVRLTAIAGVALLSGLMGVVPAAAATTGIVFADPDLAAAINLALSPDRAPDAPITAAEAEGITELSAHDAEIDSLEGIQHLTSLTALWADRNRISALTPLTGLTKLVWLSLSENSVSDARPLAGLSSLDHVWLDAQQVRLGSIPTSATQANPLRTPRGTIVVPESETAAIAADGRTWRLGAAGTHRLTWMVYEFGGAAASFEISFSGTVTQDATGPSLLTLTPTPKITGGFRVGGTLKATPGTWDAGVAVSYQWIADGVAVAGATGRTFTLGAAQHGARISVRTTGAKAGFQSVTKASALSGRVMLAPIPKITGSAKLGSKLTVARGTWTRGATLKVQWYADKLAIAKATGASLIVRSSEQGKLITVRVTGTKSGYEKVAVASTATSQVRLVTTSSRSSVRSAYRRILAPALKAGTGWTGSTSSCRLGTESLASRRATLDAVNLMRAMNQLDGVSLSDTWNTAALRNSLMMQARGQITHYPQKAGKCWSAAAATSAARSNLALGISGARAITGYMDDPGASNVVAGHRRWILEPTLRVMGTGSTTRANTLTVMGKNGPVVSPHNAAPRWMEWPSAGWFPRQLDPEGLWSLSASDAGVDFRRAKVSVTTGSGTRLAVSTYPVVDGYGPNTLTWRVKGVALPKGDSSRSYVVKVTGIRVEHPHRVAVGA
ncbi:MAG: hypothetical protein EOO67_03655, partial [Microbacterium sp.]